MLDILSKNLINLKCELFLFQNYVVNIFTKLN